MSGVILKAVFRASLGGLEGGLIESALGKAIHDSEWFQELGGASFDGYFPSYRRPA